MDTSLNYWKKGHKRYKSKEWIARPTIFSNTAIGYFPESGSLIDLGAGLGQDSILFSEKGYMVTSTDINEDAFEVSKEMAGDLEIKYEVADLRGPLPYDDSSFDIVYSHLGLHYFSEKDTKRVFKELYRILKPGGIIAALFNTVEDPEIKTGDFEKLEDHFYLEKTTGLRKAYFDVEYLKHMASGLFDPVLIDSNGETYNI